MYFVLPFSIAKYAMKKHGRTGENNETEESKPVASRARIASENALALSRRRITSLEGREMAVSWKILDKRCIFKLKKIFIYEFLKLS